MRWPCAIASDPEVRRRMALSLAISGQRDAALRMIDAQLRAHDRSAWRTQAFVLALTGDAQGADRTAQTVMPPDAAAAMAPFFDRLAGLSPAQKAMAVHFGHFPSDGRTTAYARNDVSADPGALAMAQGGPNGPMPGPSAARPRIEIPEPVSDAPRRRPGASEERRSARRTSGSEERPASLIRRPVETASAAPPPPPPPASTTPVANDIAPGFILTQQPGNGYRPSPPPPPPPALPSFNSVAETVASLPTEQDEPAAADRSADAPPPVRFDSRPLRAPETRPVATAAAPSRARNAANPSRRWVQIAHASSPALLPREYADARDDAPALLGSRNAYAARAGGTNRLLVGPFDTDAQVRAFIAQLDRRHVEAIAWTSPAGQEIERLRIPDEPRSSSAASSSARAEPDRAGSTRSSRDRADAGSQRGTASRSGSTARNSRDRADTGSRSTARSGSGADDDRRSTSRTTTRSGNGSRTDSGTRSTARSGSNAHSDSNDRSTSRNARSRSEPEPRTPARRRSTH